MPSANPRRVPDTNLPHMWCTDEKSPLPPPAKQYTLFAAAANKVVVSVTEVTAFGDFTAALVDSFEVSSPALGERASGRIEGAFLEVGEGPFRVLVISEDDSAMMVGTDGLEWVREEALAAVDQVKDGCYAIGKYTAFRFWPVAIYVSLHHGRATRPRTPRGFRSSFGRFFECYLSPAIFLAGDFCGML